MLSLLAQTRQQSPLYIPQFHVVLEQNEKYAWSYTKKLAKLTLVDDGDVKDRDSINLK
jgi:hypothetical protein